MGELERCTKQYDEKAKESREEFEQYRKLQEEKQIKLEMEIRNLREQLKREKDQKNEKNSTQQKKAEDSAQRGSERLDKDQKNRNMCVANGPTIQPNENVVFEQSAKQNLPIQRNDISLNFYFGSREVCCMCFFW